MSAPTGQELPELGEEDRLLLVSLLSTFEGWKQSEEARRLVHASVTKAFVAAGYSSLAHPALATEVENLIWQFSREFTKRGASSMVREIRGIEQRDPSPSSETR